MKEIKGGHRKLMSVMVKQLLKLSQSQRDLEGAMFDTVLVKNSTAEAMEMQSQTKAYGDGVRGHGATHTLGPPHIWAWGGLMQALTRRGPSIGAVTLQTLTDHNTWLASATTEEKADLIRFCRCHRMFNPEMRRITFSLHDQALRTAVMSALVQAGCERKLGRAPAANMERELQSYVEALMEGED